METDVAFGKIYGSWIKDLPNLCWIHVTTAGVDRLSTHAPEIKARSLIITNSAGVHAIPISEHVMAMILSLSRDIQRSIRRQIRHQWINRDHWDHITEVNGTRMGIIGAGRIGQMVAKTAKALNMEVIGTRRCPKDPVPFVDKIYGPDGLKDLLSSSDWVVVAVPLTSETEGMIGESEFKAMKKSAFIINIARGKIIQEKALIQALQKGWIAGAGLDVFEKEPLPEDSPLWDMENVVITPHHAGVSPRHMSRRFGIFIENLKRYQAGDILINTVDINLGY
jgi:phosphoglycerate dehydrogenase-like enzyme